MKRVLFVILIFISSVNLFAQNNWEIRLIPQLSFGAKNTLQRPNNSDGTRIVLNEEFSRKNNPQFSPRIELEYTIKRNHIIATAAFVKDEFSGISSRNISYNGLTFSQGSNIETDYIFNTYRLTYRYGLISKAIINFEVGGTLLFRDAYISMKDENQDTKFSNFGIAPLLSYYFSYYPMKALTLYSYGDGLAVKQGSAFDIFAGLRYNLKKNVSVSLGYRILNGGTNVDKIYNHATFNFISASLNIRL